MGELPAGWALTTLGEVCSTPQYGWTTKASKDGLVKYLRTSDISTGKINWASVPYCDKVPDEINKYKVRKDDILIARAGSVGVSHRIQVATNTDAVFASYLIRFKPYNEIVPAFIELYLKSNNFWNAISENSAGIAIPNVNASKLSKLEVPLPPYQEQRRIVAKLEKLLAKVDACKERLEKIPAILKRFRQSVLAAACSGRLTADWRDRIEGLSSLRKNEVPGIVQNTLPIELAELPENWIYTILESVIDSIKYGTSKKLNSQGVGVATLRIPNVVKGFVDLSELKYAEFSEHEYEELSLRAGDILIVRSNGSVSLVGKCALITKEALGLAYAGYLIRVRFLAKKIDPCFAHIALSSDLIRVQIELPARSTSGVHNINSEEVRKLVIPIPPLDEQHEIVHRVEALFKIADGIEKRYEKAKAHVGKLTQSILAKAFRGELVPQDPSDEPAAELLKRIQAERKIQDAEARPGRKGAGRRMRD